MRIVHTSDWHLGQQFFGHSRDHEHRMFLQWLLKQLMAQQPDVLVIAGDVFDTANPPVEAQRLLYDFLLDVHRQCPALQVVMVAGNHDSGSRIELPQPLLAAMNVHSIGRLQRVGGQRDGEVDLERLLIPVVRQGTRVGWCLALPYLRAAELTLEGGTLMAAQARLYRQLIEAAQARRAPTEALVLISHAHVQGGIVSAHSERNVVVGSVEAVSAQWFEGVDYVALGHLHKAHPLGAPHVRYSGSPLPLSMAEAGYVHQVLSVVINAGGDHPVAVTPLPVPRAVAMHRIGFDQPCDLETALAACARLPADDRPVHERDWLDVQVSLSGPPPVDWRQRLQQALTGRAVRLVKFSCQQTGGLRASPTAPPTALPSPQQLFGQLWRRHYPDSPETALAAAQADFEHLVALARQQAEAS